MPLGIAIIIFCISVSSISAAEMGLGGIRLGRLWVTVLQKYGNPEIRVGNVVQVETQTNTSSPVVPGMNPLAGRETPNTGTPGTGLTGMTPYNPFGATPSTPSLFITPKPQSQVIQSIQVKSAPEVTWVYKFSDNRSLEFLISPDGRVVQISAVGVQWSGIATAKGIHLGNTYKDIMMRYGYPDTHEQTGPQQLLLKYEKDRVIFSLLGKNLVGITIALMD